LRSTSHALPHRSDRLFITDGGIETSLIYDDGLELPCFAAFHLLTNAVGRAALVRYYERYIAIAKDAELGFVLESPTWRANPAWAERLGYSRAALAEANLAAIRLMRGLQQRHDSPRSPMLVSGCVGPRGDGYVAGDVMSPEDAQRYHDDQIAALADAECDVVTAMTMTNRSEAIGIVRAAAHHGVPCVVSFTVETDGRLPDGSSLEEAISIVDEATGEAPEYYMLNCAHPLHFASVLSGAGAWSARLAGLRANASCKSHAELNDATELDRGNPTALAEDYRLLRGLLPGLRVFGGCCGTDDRHVAAMASVLVDTRRLASSRRRSGSTDSPGADQC
jgi:homocysteine S-methyltransferase